MTDPATAALLADLRQTFTRMDDAIARLEKQLNAQHTIWGDKAASETDIADAAIRKATANPHTPWDGRATQVADNDGFVREGNEHGR